MGSDDDTIIRHGPLSAVFRWLWNYELTKQHMNALVFIGLTHLVVGVLGIVIGALLF